MDVLRDVRLYDVRSVRNSIPMNRWLKQITYNALWRSNRKRARFLLEPLPTLNSNSVVVPTPIIKYIVVPNLSINGDKLCPKRITGLCSPKIVPSQTAKRFKRESHRLLGNWKTAILTYPNLVIRHRNYSIYWWTALGHREVCWTVLGPGSPLRAKSVLVFSKELAVRLPYFIVKYCSKSQHVTRSNLPVNFNSRVKISIRKP